MKTVDLFVRLHSIGLGVMVVSPAGSDLSRQTVPIHEVELHRAPNDPTTYVLRIPEYLAIAKGLKADLPMANRTVAARTTIDAPKDANPEKPQTQTDGPLKRTPAGPLLSAMNRRTTENLTDDEFEREIARIANTEQAIRSPRDIDPPAPGGYVHRVGIATNVLEQ